MRSLAPRAPIPPGLWLALALGCVLRLFGLEVHSLWYDEAATIYEALHPDLLQILRADRHPPLSFAIFRAWIGLFGESDLALRLLPALLSCAALLLFARIAALLLDGPPLLLAVLLYAVSPFHIWHGQEVRMYVFLECGALLATLGFLLALREDRLRLGCAATSAGLAFAALSHYYGVWSALALGLSLAIALHLRQVAWRRALWIGASIALPFLLCAPLFAWLMPAQLGTGWAWQAKSSLRDLFELPVRHVIVAGAAVPDAWRFALYLLSAVLWLGFALGILRAIFRPRFAAWFSATLFLAPLGGALLLGLVGPLSLTPKYLIAGSSGTVLLIAQGLGSLSPSALRWFLGTLAVSGCLAHTLGLRVENQREDYRGAAQRVLELWEPGDLVVVVSGTYRGWSEAPVRHYLRDREEILASVRDWSEIEGHERVALAGSRRLHLVYRQAGYSDAAMRSARALGRVVREDPERLRIQYVMLERE